jgi:hypothetical protein
MRYRTALLMVTRSAYSTGPWLLRAIGGLEPELRRSFVDFGLTLAIVRRTIGLDHRRLLAPGFVNLPSTN